MASSAYRHVTACRLCGANRLLPVLDLGHTPLANEMGGTEVFPLRVTRCGDCGHHQLSIAVSPARLWGPAYPYKSGTSPVFREHLRKLADEIVALKPGGHVLEIGSNDGTLLDLLGARGLTALGVDPSGADRPDTLRESWPLPPRLLGEDWDVIVALNVFAHVDDLASFTEAVRVALAPDGVFILEVGYLRDVVDRGLFDVIYHEHLSYHSVTPLRAFFARQGLRLAKVARVESQGGSIRCYVAHDDGTPLTVDVESPIDVSGLFERWQSTLDNVRHALHGSCAGYGAPAKLTTLAHVLDLPRLDCVFDDNPLKIGRTTPGRHEPIVATAELLGRNPDTLILFSWNFADEIVPRLRALGYRGRIITPLPEMVVDG